MGMAIIEALYRISLLDICLPLASVEFGYQVSLQANNHLPEIVESLNIKFHQVDGSSAGSTNNTKTNSSIHCAFNCQVK